MNNVTYEIAFDGTDYEVIRRKAYYLSAPTRVVVAIFATREAAEIEVKFQESMDDDKIRDRQGRL